MSLHAQPHAEALSKLKRQRRTATISSLIISLLVLLLIGLVLGLLVLSPLMRRESPLVAYVTPPSPETALQDPKMQMSRAKPQAPSSARAAKVITSAVASPMSIPTVEVEVEMPSVEFGSGDDFGEGWFDSGGAGGSGGAGSGFGSQVRISGALTGSLYDFKQNRRGRPNDEADPHLFGEIVGKIQRRGFSESAFSRYFKAPNELSLTHLAIEQQDAAEGPRHFGAEKHMEPRMWLAHYAGDVLALDPGEYRFVGMADDYVSVFVDGQPALIGRRPDVGDEVMGRWKPAEDSGKWAPPSSDVPLAVGEWVEFKPGETRHLDLAIGERPGGYLHFILMVQKKGETYRSSADGRPILPLFTTGPFSKEDENSIRDRFQGYELEWEKVPVFPAQ